jgi:hypothetical protein
MRERRAGQEKREQSSFLSELSKGISVAFLAR